MFAVITSRDFFTIIGMDFSNEIKNRSRFYGRIRKFLSDLFSKGEGSPFNQGYPEFVIEPDDSHLLYRATSDSESDWLFENDPWLKIASDNVSVHSVRQINFETPEITLAIQHSFHGKVTAMSGVPVFSSSESNDSAVHDSAAIQLLDPGDQRSLRRGKRATSSCWNSSPRARRRSSCNRAGGATVLENGLKQPHFFCISLRGRNEFRGPLRRRTSR